MLVCVAGDGMETSIGHGKFLLAGRLAGRIPRMYKMYHRKKLVYAGFPCCLRHRVLFQVRLRAKNSVEPKLFLKNSAMRSLLLMMLLLANRCRYARSAHTPWLLRDCTSIARWSCQGGCFAGKECLLLKINHRFWRCEVCTVLCYQCTAPHVTTWVCLAPLCLWEDTCAVWVARGGVYLMKQHGERRHRIMVQNYVICVGGTGICTGYMWDC